MIEESGRVGCAETGSHATHEAPMGLRPPGFDPARDWETEAFFEQLGLPGWIYRDLPNMRLDFLVEFEALVGEENLRWITSAQRQWPDGAVTQRGQVMISPEGMARVAEFNRRDSDGPRMAETNEDSARGEAGPARPEGIAQTELEP